MQCREILIKKQVGIHRLKLRSGVKQLSNLLVFPITCTYPVLDYSNDWSIPGI